MTTNSTIIQKTRILLDDVDLPIIWVKDFDPDNVQVFISKLLRLESDLETAEIFVYICSEGGCAYSLLGMLDAMIGCRKPVNTVGLGICASAGGILLACGTGQRWLAENSFMHIHHVRGTLRGDGDSPACEQDVKQTQQLESRIFKLITKRSTFTVTQLRERLKNEAREWQLSAKSALKYGFIDHIGVPSIKKHIVTEYEV